MRVQNCVPSNETREMLHREHGGMFARIGTVTDFTPRPVMLPPDATDFGRGRTLREGAHPRIQSECWRLPISGLRLPVCGGDEHIGAESYQLGGESWQAILGGGITILDDQVSSINPAMVSQPLKPRFLNGRLHHIHGEKRRVPCASERRGQTSSAAWPQ